MVNLHGNPVKQYDYHHPYFTKQTTKVQRDTRFAKVMELGRGKLRFELR
jgi:hypothetical protein